MRIFENHVQDIKYNILKELVKSELNDNLINDLLLIPKKIIPGPKANTRCCIYKERAIINERIKNMLYHYDNEVIKVIDIACDECPIYRFSVTEACRGCLANHCVSVCPVNAIAIINQRAVINQDKCIECGKCSGVCQFNAISDVKRPCIKSCKIGALKIESISKKAIIDREKCINCGECVFKCPFGAITDTSNLLSLVRALKSKNDSNNKICAVIAPSIAAQFKNISVEQINHSLKKIGFHAVFEAALGADIVAYEEAKLLTEELKHKNFVTSSCCPSFVSFVEKYYPEFIDNISTTLSPMIIASRLIKHDIKDSTVVFIGPCTAKKEESSRPEFQNDVDFNISFEELRALIDAHDIDLENAPEEPNSNASYFGRLFAQSGGVAGAISQVIEEYNLGLELEPIICSGITECDKALKLARSGKLKGNFIEGMACEGGCINGPLSLSHKPKDKFDIFIYGNQSIEKTIKESVKVNNYDKITINRNR